MAAIESVVKPPSFLEAIASLFGSIEVEPGSAARSSTFTTTTSSSCQSQPSLYDRSNATRAMKGAGASQAPVSRVHSQPQNTQQRHHVSTGAFRRAMDAFFTSQRGGYRRLCRLDLCLLVIHARHAVKLQSSTYARVLDVLVHVVLEKETANVLDALLRRENEQNQRKDKSDDGSGVIQFLSCSPRAETHVNTPMETGSRKNRDDGEEEEEAELSTAEKLLYVILRTAVVVGNRKDTNLSIEFAPRLWISERTATLIERSDAVLVDMMWRCEQDPVVDSVLRGDSGDTLFNVIYKDGCAAGTTAPPALSGLRLSFEENEEEDEACDGCTDNPIPTDTSGGTWDVSGVNHEDAAISSLFTRVHDCEPDEAGQLRDGKQTRISMGDAETTSPRLKTAKMEQHETERQPCTLHVVAQERPTAGTTFRLFTPLYSPSVGSSANICGSVFVAVHRALLGEEDPFGFLCIRKPCSSCRGGKSGVGVPKQLSNVGVSQEFFVRVRASRRNSELDGPPELMRGVMGLLCDAAKSGTLFLRLQWLCHYAQEEMVCGALGSYGQAAMHSLRQLLYVLREQVIRLVSIPSGCHHITFTTLLKACRRLRPIAMSIEQLSDIFQVSDEESWSVEASIQHVSSAKILSALYSRHVKRRAAISASQLRANLNVAPLEMPSSSRRNSSQRARRLGATASPLQRSGGFAGDTVDDVYGFSLFKGKGSLDVVSTIFYAAMQPLNTMIEAWVTRGCLVDAKDEFFIVPSESIPDALLETAAGREQRKRGSCVTYTVNDSPSRLPSFISYQTANEVLHAGLSRLTLQSAADHVLSCAEKEERLLVGDALESGAGLLREFYDAIMGVSRVDFHAVPCIDPVAGNGAVAKWQAYFGACNALLYPEPLEDPEEQVNQHRSPRSLASGSFRAPVEGTSDRRPFDSSAGTNNAEDSFAAGDVEVRMSDSDGTDDETYSMFVVVQHAKQSSAEASAAERAVVPSPTKSSGADTGSFLVSAAHSKLSSRYNAAVGATRTAATSLVSVATSALQTAVLEEEAIQRRRSEQEDLHAGATRRRLTSEFGAKVDFLNQQRKFQQWRAKRLALNVDRQVAIQRAVETLVAWQAERAATSRDAMSRDEGESGNSPHLAKSVPIVIPLSDATKLEDERMLLFQREQLKKQQRMDSAQSSLESSTRSFSERVFSDRNSVSVRPPSISVTHQSPVPRLALQKATISTLHGKQDADSRSIFTSGGGGNGGSIATSFAFPPPSPSKNRRKSSPGPFSTASGTLTIASARRDGDRVRTPRGLFSGLESASQVSRGAEQTSHLSGNLSSAVLSSSYTFLVNNDVLSRSRQRQNSHTSSLARHRGASLPLTTPTVFSLRPPTVLSSKTPSATPKAQRLLPPLAVPGTSPATPKPEIGAHALPAEHVDAPRAVVDANAAPSLAEMLRMQASAKSESNLNEQEETRSASPELLGTKGELFQTVMEWDHTGSGETADVQTKWRSFHHSPALLESRDSSFCESMDGGDSDDRGGGGLRPAGASGEMEELCFYDYGAAGWSWGSFPLEQTDEERFLVSHQKLMREMRKARTHEERISMIRNVMRRNHGVAVNSCEYLQRCSGAASLAIKALAAENAYPDESLRSSELHVGCDEGNEESDSNNTLSGVWLLDLMAFCEGTSEAERCGNNNNNNSGDADMEEIAASSNVSSSCTTGKRKREVTFTSDSHFCRVPQKELLSTGMNLKDGSSDYVDPARMKEARRASPLWSPEQVHFGVFTDEQQEALGRVARYYDAIALRMSAFITHKALQFTLLPPYGTLHRLTLQLCDICLLQNSVVADRITYVWVENVLKSTQRDSAVLESKDSTKPADGSTDASPQRFDGNAAIVALNSAFLQQWEMLVVDGLDTMHVFLDLRRDTTEERENDEQAAALDGSKWSTMLDFEDDELGVSTESRGVRGNARSNANADDDEESRSSISRATPSSPSAHRTQASKLTLIDKATSPFQFLKYLRVCGRHVCNDARLLPRGWLTNYSDLFVSLLFWKTVGCQLNAAWQLGMSTAIPEVFFFCNVARAVLGSVTQHVWFQIGGHVRAYKESLTFGSTQCAVYNFTTIEDFTWHHRFFLSQCLFSALLTSEFASCRRQVYGLLRQVQELCAFLTSSVAALDALQGASGTTSGASMSRAASRAPGSMQGHKSPASSPPSGEIPTSGKVIFRTREESKAAQVQRDIRAAVGRRVQSFGALTAIFVKHLQTVQDRYLSMETDALGATAEELDASFDASSHQCNAATQPPPSGDDRQTDEMRPSGSQLWKETLQHNAIRSRTESLSYLIHTLEQTLVSLNTL